MALMREILKEFVAEGLVDVVRGVLKKSKDVASQQIEAQVEFEAKRVKDIEEHQDEFFASLHGINAANILRRINARKRQEPRGYGDGSPYSPLDGTRAVDELVSLYRSLGEEHEIGNRLNLFESLNDMGDEEFDAFIELLAHNRLRAYTKLFAGIARSTDRNTAATLFRHSRRVRDSWWAHPHRIPAIGPFIDPVGYFRERRNP